MLIRAICRAMFDVRMNKGDRSPTRLTRVDRLAASNKSENVVCVCARVYVHPFRSFVSASCAPRIRLNLWTVGIRAQALMTSQ